MLPLHYQTIKPLLKDKIRLIALTSCSYGDPECDYLQKLDRFIGNISSEEPYQMYNKHRSLIYPNLKGERLTSIVPPVEVLYGDNFKSSKMIDEKFRRGLISLPSLLKLGDPNVKYLYGTSRGFHRELYDHILELEYEALNRRYLVYNG